MKKAKRRTDPDLRPEYDFRGGVRGKYAARFAAGTNIVVLSPDVARHASKSPTKTSVPTSCARWAMIASPSRFPGIFGPSSRCWPTTGKPWAARRCRPMRWTRPV